jgi:hypothetical protein
LPASASPLLEAVVREVAELERLCGELERNLVAGDWSAAANVLRDSRRVTHAFANAMEAAQSDRDESFDRRVYVRMRRVFDVRENQLERLQVFHEQVGERLRTLSKWKVFARSIGAKHAPAPSIGLNSVR